MVLESACIPVPSEAIMLYGGFLVARGQESLFWIIAAGVAGNVVGSWIAYWVGYAKGRERALRFHWLHITEKRLAIADRWFERWGSWAVLVSRCLPIVRTFISLPAGVARMPFWRLTILTFGASRGSRRLPCSVGLPVTTGSVCRSSSTTSTTR